MATTSTRLQPAARHASRGEFVTIGGERYYAIHDVDKMPAFLVSIVSNDDHWLFVSSTGGVTAGRESPETALFPYVTVDKLHRNSAITGPRTLLRVHASGKEYQWEPFNREHDWRYDVTRSLYKSLLGNKLRFEEVNYDLQLVFRYTWASSDRYGFVRLCELENLAETDASIDIVDGLQNILPAGTPRMAQANSSNLVDAYKWNELDAESGLALFTLYSGVSDRAEPQESLQASTVFSLGIDSPTVLISSEQLDGFRNNDPLRHESLVRGKRGAYFVAKTVDLAARTSRSWQIIANTEQTQCQAIELRRALARPGELQEAIARSVQRGSDELARIMAGADGFQLTAEENVTAHHYANVLFNVLRGGTFDDQYDVEPWDFACTIEQFNKRVFDRNREFLLGLAHKVTFATLLASVTMRNDPQLERLCREYLPIRFGRRHGDPSRPWNHFSIRLKDDAGHRLLSYQGNWRDIFQNWEALAFSYPDFVENVIAKFLNASTIDGYNPYRITKEGIDWELEEPDDPWSYIGYWGDHQIVYLQKLLDLSGRFHPDRLRDLLRAPVFAYANIPYRIRPFDALLQDPKNTLDYDITLAQCIEERVKKTGADGKLIPGASGEVYQVNLFEKLLVPLLAKLGNLVLDGGIWMNTQRPEWNDANNALVGQGLSMVTLYHLRRYVSFLQRLLSTETAPIDMTGEVSTWLSDIASSLSDHCASIAAGPLGAKERYQLLVNLGQAASRYRQVIYERDTLSGKISQAVEPVCTMLDDALQVIDHSIRSNHRTDGLYHSYNTLAAHEGRVVINRLYPMLEGQVAVLNSGAIAPEAATGVLHALFNSSIYRADQHSFMLYPDRELPGFLEKNRVPEDDANAIPILHELLKTGNEQIVVRDQDGQIRFNANISNEAELLRRLNELAAVNGEEPGHSQQAVLQLYESVFDHRSFTGRSGTMFGFEGLGSIYWHMVGKLLLAVQDIFFVALEQGSEDSVRQELAEFYYRIRAGLGFNKTPAEYGAFPMDPYSHTPKHAGARQPGMTGQVKEEVLTRFGELGLRVSDGTIRVRPGLLRRREFIPEPRQFRFLDVDGNWDSLTIAANSLAFTWCQVPFIYTVSDDPDSAIELLFDDGSIQSQSDLTLPAPLSTQLFSRTGRVRRLAVTLPRAMLFAE